MNIVFKRTPSGLKNQHLFHQVDYVVFVEGGTSMNKADVYSGKYTKETEDVIFWKYVFENFVNGKKLKFKSVGSKTTIKEIAVDIIQNKVDTVLIAMDSEFDELFNSKIEHPNIYYTHGYSWENDIWNADLLKAVIEQLTALKIQNKDVEENFEKFLKDLKFAVYADAYLFKKGGSFFQRNGGYLFCVECNPADLPFVIKGIVDQRVLDKGLNKGTIYSFGSKYSVSTLKFCFGHLLADYCCQVILHYVNKRHNLKSISKDFIYRIGLKNFFDSFFLNSISYTYYEKLFKKNII